MSVDISVSITEDVVDIIATPTVNIVNVTNSASIDPGLYDLSEFTNTSPNPFVRASGLSSYVPTSRTITINGLTQDLSINRSWTIPATTWGTITGTLSAQTDLQSALDAKVPTTRTLTINGTTQDLSADRTFTISTGITIGTTAITSGTVGRVLFEGAGNVVQESAGLTYNDTTGVFTLLGPIGSVFQHTALTNYNGLGGFQLNVADGTERGFFKLNPTTGEVRIGATGSGYFPTFYAQGVEAMRIFASTRNVSIGTTTDAGFKLDVNGTARFQGSVTQTGTSNSFVFGNGLEFNRDGGTTRFFCLSQINYQSNNVSAISHNFNHQSSQLTGTFINISGGTFGFASTSNILNVASIFIVKGSGNTLIGTTTDAGFKLDVNGTARVQGASYFGTTSGNVGIGTTTPDTYLTENKVLTIFNATSSQLSLVGSRATDDILGTISFWNGTTRVGDINTIRDGALGNGAIRFRTSNSSTLSERMRINTSGNVLINTTTDAGFRLDVNGSTRIKGAGTTVATLSLDVQNSSGASSVTCYDDLSVYINGKNTSGYTTNIRIGGQSNQANISFFGNNNIYVGQGGSVENIPSALIAMGSTTKGFLPPRMTTTQRNAIASPAAGLMVYDTTLNVMMYYNGTMWI